MRNEVWGCAEILPKSRAFDSVNTPIKEHFAKNAHQTKRIN